MNLTKKKKPIQFVLAALTLAVAADAAFAGPLRDMLGARRGGQQSEALDDGDTTQAVKIDLPPGAQVIRDVAYGRDNEQRFDVYLPRQPQNAPVILMVHGGGWRNGDKANRSVLENKVPHWLSKGFIFISANYRLLPKADPVTQAEDVTRALAAAQRNAASWGGDPAKFILMGHSAGAHLVALVSADPDKAYRLGASPWLGAVALDGAALDVVSVMEQKHLPLHDDAFGTDPAYWRRASPYHHLSANAVPMLAVCSSERKSSCSEAHHFEDKARSLGVRVQVSEQALSHREINVQLGEQSRYTETVDLFIASLLRGNR